VKETIRLTDTLKRINPFIATNRIKPVHYYDQNFQHIYEREDQFTGIKNGIYFVNVTLKSNKAILPFALKEKP